MKRNNWEVIPSRPAGSIGIVYRVHCRWVLRATDLSGIIGSGVRSKDCDLDAQNWVTGRAIAETASVRMPSCKHPSSVYATGSKHLVDQVRHKVYIVDIGPLSAWPVGRVGPETIAYTCDIHCDAVRVENIIIHACLTLDVQSGRTVPMESQNQRGCSIRVVVAWQVDQDFSSKPVDRATVAGPDSGTTRRLTGWQRRSASRESILSRSQNWSRIVRVWRNIPDQGHQAITWT